MLYATVDVLIVHALPGAFNLQQQQHQQQRIPVSRSDAAAPSA